MSTAKQNHRLIVGFKSVAIIFVLWALGFFTATGGALMHVLLVIALILVIVQLISWKRV
ncbi:lmo0937 family membrane protein [Trichococcus collinsii]|uniref:lmo0937 family membrane protein n=1 Tax=Trichococcus collinsii TaxID=157076 RepID=UPI00115FD561